MGILNHYETGFLSPAGGDVTIGSVWIVKNQLLSSPVVFLAYKCHTLFSARWKLSRGSYFKLSLILHQNRR